jgi:hypothetical protein
LERETGIEPATFSLGRWLKIENKEHSEFRHLFQAIEFRQNSQFSAARLLTEFKWSSLITELHPAKANQFPKPVAERCRRALGGNCRRDLIDHVIVATNGI